MGDNGTRRADPVLATLGYVALRQGVNYVADDLGRVVLMDVETGDLWGLDDSASIVWKVLVQSGSVASAAEALVREYGIDPELALADVDALVADLADNRILTLKATE